MREVPLANGRGVALVDDADYELVSRYRWHVAGKRGRYAAAYVGGGRTYGEFARCNFPDERKAA